MTSFLWVPVLLVGPFGATELLIILGIVILIFGGSRLPSSGRVSEPGSGISGTP